MDLINCEHCSRAFRPHTSLQRYCPDKLCQRARKTNAAHLRAQRVDLPEEKSDNAGFIKLKAENEQLKTENEQLKKGLADYKGRFELCYSKFVMVHGAYKYAVEVGNV
jgi:hypothetical protein